MKYSTERESFNHAFSIIIISKKSFIQFSLLLCSEKNTYYNKTCQQCFEIFFDVSENIDSANSKCCYCLSGERGEGLQINHNEQLMMLRGNSHLR